jgi:DNA-binding transcriptional LysR family regulator
MKIEDLEAFLCTARTLNISAAARMLGIPPSTFSERLKSAEDQLGQLFDRQGRLTLTSLGSRLLPDAAEAVEAARRMLATGTERRREPALRLGVIESVEHTWLFSWLALLRGQLPKLEFVLRVDTTDALDEAVARGTLDLAIAARPLGDRPIHKEQLASLTMQFLGRADRYGAGPYRFAYLAREGIITFLPQSHPHRSVMRLLGAERVEQYRLDCYSSIAAMIKAVQQGFGVATLPSALGAHDAGLGLCRVACDSAALPALPIWISWPTPVAPAAQAAVESLLLFAKPGERT